MTEFEPDRDATPLTAPIAPDVTTPPYEPQHAPPPYGQAPYSSLPYAQAPYGQAPHAQAPTWGSPPAQWQQQPPKKRKAWPWVVGIVGGLVVIGGGALALALGVNAALNADQNENYTGTPITEADEPVLGDTLLISEDGALAFEIGSSWVDANQGVDVSGMLGPMPEGGSLMAAYFTSDPLLAVDVPPAFVTVIEYAPSDQLGSIEVASVHRDFMAGTVDSFEAESIAVGTGGPNEVTTALGLDGLVSTFACEVLEMPVRAYVYTFARGDHVAIVQVYSYTTAYDTESAALVTDSLRIEK